MEINDLFVVRAALSRRAERLMCGPFCRRLIDRSKVSGAMNLMRLRFEVNKGERPQRRRISARMLPLPTGRQSDAPPGLLASKYLCEPGLHRTRTLGCRKCQQITLLLWAGQPCGSAGVLCEKAHTLRETQDVAKHFIPLERIASRGYEDAQLLRVSPNLLQVLKTPVPERSAAQTSN